MPLQSSAAADPNTILLKSDPMSTVAPAPQTPPLSSAEVAERVRSLQLNSSERKTSEFGLRGTVWLVLIAIVGGGVWWLAQRTEFSQDALRQWIPGRQVRWEVVPVRIRGGEEILLDLTGYITPKTKVNVSPRIPGVLTELHFEEGERVEAGQVLARLDDTTFRADYEQAAAAQLAADSRLLEMKNGALPEELEQARTAVAQAKDKLALSEKEYARMERIKADLSESEWDQMNSALSDARANLRTLEQKLKLMEDGPRPERIQAVEAEVAQAKALVAKAKIALDNTIITAPISGVVLERHGEVGENVRLESMAGSLYVLADLSQLEVQVDVEEQSLGKLQVGQPCRVIPDAYPDRTYAAKIARWQPQVNRARAVVRVILSITEPDELLLAEMNCRAVILATNEKPEPETLWVPASAVVAEEAESAVYVVEDGMARRRVVQVGATRDGEVEITNGLSKTERVILSGKQPLADGMKIQ
jgi:HlyD family secretion protein